MYKNAVLIRHNFSWTHNWNSILVMLVITYFQFIYSSHKLLIRVDNSTCWFSASLLYICTHIIIAVLFSNMLSNSPDWSDLALFLFNFTFFLLTPTKYSKCDLVYNFHTFMFHCFVFFSVIEFKIQNYCSEF